MARFYLARAVHGQCYSVPYALNSENISWATPDPLGYDEDSEWVVTAHLYDACDGTTGCVLYRGSREECDGFVADMCESTD